MPSLLHLKVKEKLSKTFPGLQVYEEYSIPGGLRFDFLIPSIRLAIEADGLQHEKYNSHFYSSSRDFLDAVERDIAKEKYCEENKIHLIRIRQEVLNNKKFDELFESFLLEMLSNTIDNIDELPGLEKEEVKINPRTEQAKKYYESQKEKLKKIRQQKYQKYLQEKRNA